MPRANASLRRRDASRVARRASSRLLIPLDVLLVADARDRDGLAVHVHAIVQPARGNGGTRRERRRRSRRRRAGAPRRSLRRENRSPRKNVRAVLERGGRAVRALGPRTYLTTTLCSDLVTTSPSKVTRPCLRSALASERLHTPCLWRCGRAAFEHFGFGILTDERGRTDVGFALGVPGEDFVHAVGLVHGRASGPVRHEHPPLLHALVLLRSDDDPLVVLLPQLLLRERRHHRGIKRRGLGTRLFEACRIARGARGREKSGSCSGDSSKTRRGCVCGSRRWRARLSVERRSRGAT